MPAGNGGYERGFGSTCEGRRKGSASVGRRGEGWLEEDRNEDARFENVAGRETERFGGN